jgi:hypothetical protein
MNEINRELKGYTASGTSISLGSTTSRRMASTIGNGAYKFTGSISMSDFYGARSHIAIVAGSVSTPGGFKSGYIKDYYGSGSHLGSLSTSAGVYIPSSGDTSNSLTEREVLECYTIDLTYNSYHYFYLKLAGQVYAQNTFTGIKELSPFGTTLSSGMGTRALADADLALNQGNPWQQWRWTSTTYRWSGGTKYIHWY